MAAGTDGLDLTALRARRDAVRAEETVVSYRRRLLHAQLDIVAGLEGAEPAVPLDVVAAIADQQPARPAPARAVETGVGDVEGVPPLPDDLRSMDADGRAALVERLRAAERELSTRRRALLDELDGLQDELVRRYRTDGVDAAAIIGGDA